MILECKSEDDFRRLLANSHQKPVFILKHSTACGLSAAAHREFADFAEEDDRAEYWQVLVRENRNISHLVAAETGISHESPQLILLRGGRPVWNCSHHEISGKAMESQLQKEVL